MGNTEVQYSGLGVPVHSGCGGLVDQDTRFRIDDHERVTGSVHLKCLRCGEDLGFEEI